MTRPMEPAAKLRTGAVILAAALLFCGEARAQVAGGGGAVFGARVAIVEARVVFVVALVCRKSAMGQPVAEVVKAATRRPR